MPSTNYEKDFVHIPEKQIPVIVPVTVEVPRKRRHPVLRFFVWTIFILIVLAVSLGIYGYKTIMTPVVVADGSKYPFTLTIAKGANLSSIGEQLYYAGIINSESTFRIVMLVTGKEASVKTGEYTFKGPLSMFETIDKLVNGRYEYTPIKLTIKEGEDSRSISSTTAVLFPKLNNGDFYLKLREKEGRVFPETYSFPPFATIEDIFKSIDKEFEKRIAKYKPQMASSTYSETELLTIASILEKEVPRPSDMKMVAGIIENRLKVGMPLQMDSTLGYITGKASLELTTDDLKMDSPYNTYVAKGLPPAPIGNPGDASLDAALNPEKHEYLFFLSDKNGDNHYAKTYAEHLKNRKTYLGK